MRDDAIMSSLSRKFSTTALVLLLSSEVALAEAVPPAAVPPVAESAKVEAQPPQEKDLLDHDDPEMLYLIAQATRKIALQNEAAETDYWNLLEKTSDERIAYMGKGQALTPLPAVLNDSLTSGKPVKAVLLLQATADGVPGGTVAVAVEPLRLVMNLAADMPAVKAGQWYVARGTILADTLVPGQPLSGRLSASHITVCQQAKCAEAEDVVSLIRQRYALPAWEKPTPPINMVWGDTPEALKKNFNAVLASKGIVAEAVRYGTIALPTDPSAPVTIASVEIFDPNAPANQLMTLTDVTLSKIEKTGNIFQSAHVDIKGVRVLPHGFIYLITHGIDPSGPVRSFKNIVDERLTATSTTVSFDFSYTPISTPRKPLQAFGPASLSNFSITLLKPGIEQIGTLITIDEISVSDLSRDSTFFSFIKAKSLAFPLLEFFEPPATAPIMIGELSISDVEIFKTIPIRGKLTITDLDFPLFAMVEALENEKNGNMKRNKENLANLFEMGYHHIILNIAAEANINPSTGKIFADINFKSNDMYSIRVGSTVSKVDHQVAEALVQLWTVLKDPSSDSSTTVNGMIEVARMFAGVALDDFQLEIYDLGMRTRSVPVIAKKIGMAKTTDEILSGLSTKIKKEGPREIMKLGLSQAMAKDISEKVSLFMKEGGALKFSTHIQAPIQIFIQEEGIPSALMPEFHSIPALFNATGMTLER